MFFLDESLSRASLVTSASDLTVASKCEFAFLRKLDADQWTRGAIHPVRGRFTIDDLASLMAAHDDNHLDQLRRALDGRA